MKKTYMTPSMTVVRIQHQGLLMQLSNVDSNADLRGAGDGGNITGSSGSARTKEFGSIWDEEW